MNGMTLLSQATIDPNTANTGIPNSNIPTDFGAILQWGIWALFVVAGIIVAYNIIQGGLQWVQSTGDKEKIDKARQRITASVIGLIILFATLAMIALIENIFGVGLGLTKPIFIPSFCSEGGVSVPCFQTPQ